MADVIANVLLVLTNSNNNRADVIAMLLFLLLLTDVMSILCGRCYIHILLQTRRYYLADVMPV